MSGAGAGQERVGRGSFPGWLAEWRVRLRRSDAAAAVGWRAWVTPVVIAGLVGLLVAIGSALVVLAGTPVYTSSATLLINQPAALSVADNAGLLTKLSELRYDYAGLISTAAFAGPVAAATGLPESEVASSLAGVVAPTSLLMTLEARAGTARLAQRLARVGAEYLVSDAASEQAANHVPVFDRYVFSIVTPAPPGVQIAPSHHRALEIGLATGFLVGAVVFTGLVLARR